MTSEALELLRSDFISGKNQKLKEIYLQFKPDCRRVLLSKNYCDANTVEDIYNDAIIIFRKNLIQGKIKELPNLKAYLNSICINLSRENKRKILRSSKKAEEVRLLLYENNHNVVEDDNELSQERINICRKALKTLSERCQNILTSFYVHQMSMKEIAEQLGLSSKDVAKTLKSRCYKSWIAEVKNQNH